MGFFRKRHSKPEERPRPVAPPKPKRGKCKIKWKVGKDGSETFESTPECTDANIERAMQMRANRKEGGSEDG